MSDLVTVDDLAYDQIHYSSTPPIFWDHIELPDDPDVWDGGVSAAKDAGMYVTFSFTGSQISVYGRVVPAANGSQQPLSLYSVGSQKLQAFIPDDVTEATDNVAFFNSSVMPYGQYTLVVNITRADSNAPYFLDYFRYNTTNPDAPSSSSSTSTSSTGTSTGIPSATGIASSGASSSSSPLVGAIVGGVLGGVAFLAAVVFAFFCYRMRKRKAKIFLSPNGEKTSPTSITPYVLADGASSQARFSDMPALPVGAPSMQQYGSTHSLGTATPSENRTSKAAMARQERYLHPLGGPSSAYGDEYLGAPGPASSVHSPSSHSSSHPSSRSHTHSNHSPHSTVHDLPAFASRGRAHAKGTRSESAGLLGATSSGPSSPTQPHPNAQQPQDSGLRFEPGVTPSDVAPVLPPGATPGPIRSTATMSEVARADIPPAYTPE
ncbi:hypothetical protein L226DRAFT_617389 [Lentinus tigrinus ALCF2SS1-7]|uniref:Uncharacterized protein n=1 Tax=Lentinus tigrinus ALCF2SS1-6 TaxID=1328759 RepID=A0A5C2RP82_9APHY|nr:hypothetical protein L227DRAFT_596349 [Lentinus tigrinus ALCF2SS1-6]RPD68677.1 hypothetical protein L226DRAFT_617389 [Lentinus tigrinus ALCF2SS1-7]